MSTRLLAYRRSLTIATVWVAAMATLVATSPSASGQEGGVEPGLGSAYAQGYKVDPRSGRLSFGITYGMALAGHQNDVAVAEARSVDLGVIGTTLAAAGCDGGDPTFPKEDQPQPLVVRSTEEKSEEGKSETENAVEKRAMASDRPIANAVAITAAAGEAAVVKIGSTVSETTSGIVDGVRQARATTEVSHITFADGAVVLKGLRWDAVWQSAPQESAKGTFTIDGIVVGGQTIAPPEGNPLAGLAEANTVLRPLGFNLEPPTVRNESGISFVDPLRIGIVPSQAREEALGPIFQGLQPVREGLFDALIEADCSNASLLTIGDIVLGSATGAGSFNLELGGVTATSSDLKRTSFLGGLGGGSLSPLPPSPSLGVPDVSAGGLDAGGGSFTPADTASGGDAGASEPEPASSDEESALPDVQRASGSRGGPLVWVGLGGLLLLAALAEGDRRKMRRAQRSVPMEVTA